MASTRLLTRKNGTQFYEIIVSRGRKLKPLTMRWDVPQGWSKKSIERELGKVSADFETRCKNGDAVSRKEQAEIDAKEKEDQAKIETVKQYAERVFMPTKNIECKKNTRLYYQNALDNHILPYIGPVKMPEVTSAQIKEVILKAQSAGKSHSTILGIHVTCNQLFEMAYLSDLIPSNPVDKVKRPKKPQDAVIDTEDEYFSESELHTILEYIEDEAQSTKTLKWKAYINLMMVTGCRRGEICGLRWRSVRFESNQIKIENNLCYNSSDGVYDETPKGKKCRIIDISPEVMDILRAYKREQAEKMESKIPNISAYVFVQDDMISPMHPQSPDKFFKEFGKRHNIKDFHPHKLRHSFASVAITNGADISSISEILGHADKSTTLRRYTHADAVARRRASNVFFDSIKVAKEQEQIKQA